MLYNVLHIINRMLLTRGYEIRKKQTAPFYYLQNFETPDMSHENGIYTISIDKIISPHFFSYGEEGWHYYTACLREYEKNPEVTYDTSILKKYYDSFQPQTVADILFYDNPKSAPEVLQNMPALLIRDFWRLNGNLDELTSQLLMEETQLYGPISHIYGEEQFTRCLNAYRMIEKHGYLPDRFEDGYIGGYFIFNGDDYRFVAMTGKHRLAALSILGHTAIKAHCPYNLKTLDLNTMAKWPTVQSGLLSQTAMLDIAKRCFDEAGTGFAEQYVLGT